MFRTESSRTASLQIPATSTTLVGQHRARALLPFISLESDWTSLGRAAYTWGSVAADGEGLFRKFPGYQREDRHGRLDISGQDFRGCRLQVSSRV